jgi:hypothetical protein
MLYTNLRNLVLNSIPGAGLASFVYLGMLVFVIASLVTYRKWAPFIATLVFAAIMGFLDNAIVELGTPAILYHGMHMLMIPFLVTFLYFKRR